MALRYIAKIYCGKEVIAEQDGDDVDDLYTWMMVKSADKFGNMSGDVIDNKTGKPVRSFRKDPTD